MTQGLGMIDPISLFFQKSSNRFFIAKFQSIATVNVVRAGLN